MNSLLLLSAITLWLLLQPEPPYHWIEYPRLHELGHRVDSGCPSKNLLIPGEMRVEDVLQAFKVAYACAWNGGKGLDDAGDRALLLRAQYMIWEMEAADQQWTIGRLRANQQPVAKLPGVGTDTDIREVGRFLAWISAVLLLYLLGTVRSMEGQPSGEGRDWVFLQRSRIGPVLGVVWVIAPGCLTLAVVWSQLGITALVAGQPDVAGSDRVGSGLTALAPMAIGSVVAWTAVRLRGARECLTGEGG